MHRNSQRRGVRQRGNEETHWQEVHKETRAISSWPYWGVWETRRIWLLTIIAASLLLGAVAFVLGAVNPRLPWNWGWNTISHVADIRFWKDYTTSLITAMAGSVQWLAL